MTRVFVPPPTSQAHAQNANFAQSLRTASADAAPERNEFQQALTRASDRQTVGATDHAPEKPQGESTVNAEPKDTPRDEGDDGGQDDPTDQATQVNASQSGQEQSETRDAPRDDGPPVDQASDPASAGQISDERSDEATDSNAEAAVSIHPAQTGTEAETQTITGDVLATPSDSSPSVQTEGGAPVASEATAQSTRQPEPDSNVRREPAETETGRRALAARAPTAEDQARESIEVETRFDAAIRDKVRHAARVDLAALAAEKLTRPTQRIPGDLRDPSTPVLVSNDGARTGDLPPTGAESEPRPVQNVVAGVASTNARPQDALASLSGRGAPTTAATPPVAVAPPAGTDLGSNADTGARQQSQAATAAVAVSAAPPPTAPPSSGARSFDRAIAALRSLEQGRAPTRQKPAGAGRSRQEAPANPANRARPVLAQVSRGVASILRQEGGSLTLRLRPDTLGDLKISLRVKNGGVEATFKADNAQARGLLQSTMSQLKETLESNGVRVDRLRVEVENERPQDAGSPRSEHRGRGGDGSPGFDDPSETGGREGDSRHGRHGGRGGAQGRGSPDGSGVIDAAETAERETAHDPARSLDAEADRDGSWIGLDTLA